MGFNIKSTLWHSAYSLQYLRAFAEKELQLLNNDPDSLAIIVATGRTLDRPAWYQEQPLHSPKVVVWGDVWKYGVIGPFIFYGNVNGDNYLEMLKQFLH